MGSRCWCTMPTIRRKVKRARLTGCVRLQAAVIGNGSCCRAAMQRLNIDFTSVDASSCEMPQCVRAGSAVETLEQQRVATHLVGTSKGCGGHQPSRKINVRMQYARAESECSCLRMMSPRNSSQERSRLCDA